MYADKKHIVKLKQHVDVLKTIAHCKPKIRLAILKNADKDLIEVICHCVFNLLIGHISLSEKEKDNLKAYKNILSALEQKSSFNNKKKILVQQGGFLEYLIPEAITGISSIISSYIGNSQ